MLTKSPRCATAYDVPEAAELGDGVVRAPAGAWQWADSTCRYARAMIDAWPTATGAGDTNGRHPWLASQSVRLAAAHRYGCLTEADHAAAGDALAVRMAELCRRETDPRDYDAAEVARTLAWGVVRAETLTNAEVLKELGGSAHGHAVNVWLDGAAAEGETATEPEPEPEADPPPNPRLNQQPEAEPEAEADPAAGWEPLRRLDAERAPPFPTECLPEPVRGFVTLVADRVQIDPVIPAVMALGVLGALVQKSARVAGPGWSEQLSLFVLALADVSERKSPACR